MKFMTTTQYPLQKQRPQQQQTAMTSIALSKLVILLQVIMMITVANRPTLIFLTNTTNTAVNAFVSTTFSIKSHYERKQKTMTFQNLNCDSTSYEESCGSQSRHLVNISSRTTVSRNDMIRSVLVLGWMNVVTTSPLMAAAVDTTTQTTAITGTKQDPKYESCLSKCMYDCTKPKGNEQKSRAVCLPECKAQCATTKQQLMIGTPIK